jgi:hypothetical protein
MDAPEVDQDSQKQWTVASEQWSEESLATNPGIKQ